jgi:hypothetical protein
MPTVFLQMIKLIGFAFFVCSACPALAIDREFGHPLFRTFTARDYGEIGQIFAVTEDARGCMLFGCGNAIVAFDNNHWETIPAPGTGFIDGEPVAWIAGDYGLMRVVLDRATLSKRKFELYPSRIVTADGAPIFVRDGKEPTLKYDDRDFQIRFGTDRFSVGDKLHYQARLEGTTDHRSPVTTSAVWRSGALNEGHYLLHVQARDNDGNESKEYTFAFGIAPPWYRTLWMDIVWGLLIVVAFYLFSLWRTWQMRLRHPF